MKTYEQRYSLLTHATDFLTKTKGWIQYIVWLRRLIMKPSKSVGNKSDLNNSKPTTIEDYFQSAPKDCIKETRCNVSDTKAYYIEALKTKLKRKNIFVFIMFIYCTSEFLDMLKSFKDLEVGFWFIESISLLICLGLCESSLNLII